MYKFYNKIHDPLNIADYEADLQEVWSVRKNIHHSGSNKQVVPSSNSSSAVLGTQVKAGLYSRHGAIPAQPAMSKGSFSRGVLMLRPASYPYRAGMVALFSSLILLYVSMFWITVDVIFIAWASVGYSDLRFPLGSSLDNGM